MAKYYFASDAEARNFMKSIVESVDFAAMMENMFPKSEKNEKKANN